MSPTLGIRDPRNSQLLASSSQAVPASEAKAQKTPAKVRKLRILVADDNESFTETFGCMLEMLGHEVRRAHNGTEALTTAQSFLPDVILLDINLPEVNGYDVCKQVRTMSALKDSFLIAQTGYSQPEHRERSRTAGFNLHLVKPIKIDLMEEVLRSLDNLS